MKTISVKHYIKTPCVEESNLKYAYLLNDNNICPSRSFVLIKQKLIANT